LYIRLSLQEASSTLNCAASAAQVAGSLNRHVAQDRQAAEPGTFTLCDKIGQSAAVLEVASANLVLYDCTDSGQLPKGAGKPCIPFHNCMQCVNAFMRHKIVVGLLITCGLYNL
jgi:hypothetical protein